MSRHAVALVKGRLPKPDHEGDRILPYDDATGKDVRAPEGNLSWGWGFNLMQCGSDGLFEVMADYLLCEVDDHLQRYGWYPNLDPEPTRQSVFLEIAYNAGLGGLLHFPKMIAAAAAGDWVTCVAECSVKVTNPKLDASRYAGFRQLLTTGEHAP